MPNQSFLTFRIQGLLFATDVLVVREILWLPELTSIEEAPPYIAGVFNLRGKIIPVIDLNIRLGHPPQKYHLTDSVIVTEIEGRLMGMIANEVHDVISIPPEDIEELSFYPKSKSRISKFKIQNLKSKIQLHFITGEAKVGEDIIMVLNHANVFRITELSKKGALKEEGSAHTTGHRYFCPEASPEERAIFHERAQNVMHTAEGADTTGLLPLAVVGLSGEYFGVELELVREFADMNNLTPVPCCPGHIVGNVNLRGNIVTVVDIRHLLNMPAGNPRPSKKVVVAGIGELLLGVAVDNVFDAIYLKPSDLFHAPSAVERINEIFVKGAAPYGGKLMTILNLSNILTQNDLVVNEEA